MMVGAASIAGQWNDVLPSQLTLRHLADAVRSNAGEELLTSLVTGLIASAHRARRSARGPRSPCAACAGVQRVRRA